MKYLYYNCFSFIFILIIFFTPLNAQVSIDLRLFNTDARTFYVGDLDPTGVGNAPNYYSLALSNTGPPVDVQIVFELKKDDIVLARGESNVFTLPESEREFIFYNNQLNTGVALIPPDTEIRLEFLWVDFSRIEEVESSAERTGKLIAGIYEFWVEAQIYQNGVPAGDPIPDSNRADNILNISNPSTLEPISPGVRVNQDELPEIPTTTPYFIWQSDAERFNLYVYKAYENESVQDVLSREWVLNLQNYPNQVFQYPTETEPLIFEDEMGNRIGGSEGAVRLLEPGFTYYWYVEARVPVASSAETFIKTDVYQFKVTDRETTEMEASLILIYLRQILGDRYEEVMQNLQGYNPTGQIYLNGELVEIDELVKLIEKINRGQANVQEFSVPQQ
jgi:hypothetical protein